MLAKKKKKNMTLNSATILSKVLFSTSFTNLLVSWSLEILLLHSDWLAVLMRQPSDWLAALMTQPSDWLSALMMHPSHWLSALMMQSFHWLADLTTLHSPTWWASLVLHLSVWLPHHFQWQQVVRFYCVLMMAYYVSLSPQYHPRYPHPH